MWDRINKSGADKSICYETIREIYHDICILNVLSCIEIDKAKKEFDISSGRELREIKERWVRRTEDDKVMKPAFLGYIAQTKGYQNTEKKQYDYHQTTMDYLLKEIRQYRSQKTKANGFVPLSECFRFPDFRVNSVNKKQLYKIIDMCEATVAAINAVWAAEYYTLEERYLLAQQYRDNLAEEIEKMKINKHTLFVLLTYTDKKKYTHIAKLLFFVLFHYKNEMLIEIMSRLNETNSYIKEEKEGELDLYGIKFTRCTKQGLHCIGPGKAM